MAANGLLHFIGRNYDVPAVIFDTVSAIVSGALHTRNELLRMQDVGQKVQDKKHESFLLLMKNARKVQDRSSGGEGFSESARRRKNNDEAKMVLGERHTFSIE